MKSEIADYENGCSIVYHNDASDYNDWYWIIIKARKMRSIKMNSTSELYLSLPWHSLLYNEQLCLNLGCSKSTTILTIIIIYIKDLNYFKKLTAYYCIAIKLSN